MARRGRPTATPETEVDIRLNILNTLLKTPHRNLSEVHPVHAEMIKQDPLFYVRLAAWYDSTGEIRDHKEMFIIMLCLSDFEGHRDVGLALLRQLPPYQLFRVIDFIRGRKIKVREKVATPRQTGIGGSSRRKAVRPTYTTKLVDVGLHKGLPRSTRKEIEYWLREREASKRWFDNCALGNRKRLKSFYKTMQIKPSERAQQILFDNNPPEDSSLFALKRLCKADTPAEQAQLIVEYKIPYRIASTVIHAMTPSVLVALIEVMSDQELLNSMGSLKTRGAFDNDDIKALIHKRLEKAKKGKRVAAMKGSEAIKASGVDEETQKLIEDVSDAQLKSKARIKRSTAILVDKSLSMKPAIDIGKRLAAMISAIMDADLYVYAFDSMPHRIQCDGTDLASWETAFRGIYATGGTSCGVGIQALLRNKQRVEQIIMVTDEGHNTSPPFLTTLENYAVEFGMPHIVFVKCGRHYDGLEKNLVNAGHAFDAYEFDGDYYSLPAMIPFLTQPSKTELLMNIMDTLLPTRKGPHEVKEAVPA
tara:strand:+ start:5571 stop:7169 length:1599 start_codon:yes stop_codon:yes gene_type:complete